MDYYYNIQKKLHFNKHIRLNPQLGQGKGSYFFFPPFNPNLAMQLEEKRDNQTLENFYCHMRTLNPEAKIGPALGE